MPAILCTIATAHLDKTMAVELNFWIFLIPTSRVAQRSTITAIFLNTGDVDQSF